MTIFQFALIRSLRNKILLLLLYAVPLAMIFIRPLWTSENSMGFSFYAMIIMFAAFSLVRSIMSDRITGTVVRIFAAPVTTLRYFFQSLCAFWLIISVQIFILVTAGTVLYNWEVGMAVRLTFSYVIFTVTAIAFSLAWDSMFRSKMMSDSVFSIVTSFMALLGGIFIPIAMLPDFLRNIGMVFPVYWVSKSLLSVQGQETSSNYWLSIFIMILFAAAFLLYGSKRRLE